MSVRRDISRRRGFKAPPRGSGADDHRFALRVCAAIGAGSIIAIVVLAVFRADPAIVVAIGAAPVAAVTAIGGYLARKR
jgi:hypothetical protein